MSAEFEPKLEYSKLAETTSETATSETNDLNSKMCDDCNPLLYSVKEEIVDYKQEEPSNDIIYKGVSLEEISSMYSTDTIAIDGVKVELYPINNNYDVVKEEKSMIDKDRIGEMIWENLEQVSEINSKETDLISDAEITEDKSFSVVHPAQDQSCSNAEVYVEHYTVPLPGPVKKKRSPPKPSLQCLFCDVTFQNKGGLKKHIAQTHSDIKHCALCGKIFATVKVLLDHLHQYHTEKDVKCQICFKIQKKYKTSLLLLEHMIRCHNPYSSACKKPKQKEAKQNPKTYPCTVCRHQFKTKKMVTHHRIVIHHIIPDEAIADLEGYLKLNCSKCSFARRQHILDSHIGKDTKCKTGPQNTIKCVFNNRAKRYQLRAAKRRLNLTKYCYKCRYCNAGSEDREIMKTHLEYSHSRSQTIGKYEHSIMPRLKLFCCKICPAVFHHWGGYVIHMNSEFSHQHCEICLKRNQIIKGVRATLNLPLHRDRKHGILLLCPKTIESFDDRQSYENHKLQRHYYCDICDVVSCSYNEYKAHIKILHKDMVYVCEHCGKVYLGCRSLSKHRDVCSKLKGNVIVDCI